MELTAGRSYVLFVPIVLAVVLAVGALATLQRQGPVTAVARPLGNIDVFASSEAGLFLQMGLSSNEVNHGNQISVTIDEKNPTYSDISVTAANRWAIPGLSLGPCGTMNLPIGVEIVKGYYTEANINEAKPIDLYGPGIYNCPDISVLIQSYQFPPRSDVSGMVESGSSSLVFTEMTGTVVNYSGYWKGGNGFLQGSANFTKFDPGNYTVVGGDEWGALVVLHFLVVEPVGSGQPFPINFTLSLDRTRLEPGWTITIVADAYNTLPRIINASRSSSPVYWMPDTCPTFVEIFVLRGYYSQSNFSVGTPLHMQPYGLAIPCPALLQPNYVFQPSSDLVSTFNIGALEARAQVIAKGYYGAGQLYNFSLPDGGETVSPFEPGVYTVVAVTDWGQLAVSHFEVV